MTDPITHGDAPTSDPSSIFDRLAQAGQRTQTVTVPIEVIHDGNVLFVFRVRPLLDSEQDLCYEKSTRYQKLKGLGGARMPQETDQIRYRSWLIYLATVPEDRKSIWDNKKAQKHFGVLDGPGLIDRLLLAGEKSAVVDKINTISGFVDSAKVVGALMSDSEQGE